MKLSLNWIKEYVDIPAEYELSKIAYDLTMATVEVEGWEDIEKNFDKIIVGEVLGLDKHPNADKLTLCQVNIGGGEVKEIVCGGSNLRVGMKVAVSAPGAMVRWHGEGDLIEIKKSKVRGVESFGMICASSEIGLFDLFPYTEEATICDLSAFDSPAGTNVAVALGINDVILEIDNKSLTNRPDLWGHYGIARELSAFYGLPLKEIAPCEISAPEMEITLEDAARSPRYIGVKIEGLAVKPSPFEIQTRLWRVGLRPINAIVDITNYVMLATGQPTHAFDSDKIAGHITVRRAKDGEKLLLLDDKELTLTPEDLVIADDKGSVGLAGVMGGKRDSVLPETNKIILEIANFEPIGIRRTASRYDARTDAATRYEKGIDPQRVDIALAVGMQLFAQIYPENKVTGYRDNFPQKLERKEVIILLDALASRLGKRLPNAEMQRTLELLGFSVEFAQTEKGEIMKALAPTWRSTGDISIPDDIMEELARMHGYENFEAAPIVTSFTNAINQPMVSLDRNIREFLAFRCGMREVFTYPWVKDEFINAILGGSNGLHSLSAPPAPDEKFLRPSLLPNICKAVAGNVRYFNEFSIFESAQVFLSGEFVSDYDKREALPVQRRNIAGAIVGGAEDVTALFRRAKGVLEALPRQVHIENYSFERIEKPFYADETVWLNIVFGGKVIGNLALLSKKAALACGIKNNAVMLFELDIDALQPFTSRDNKFTHLPAFPLNEYDLSLLFDSSTKWAEIYDAITAKKGDLFRGVSFVDEYRGKQIPEGKKSVTFRLLLGSHEKTLNSSEIENFANSVTKRLSKQLGAETRAQ
ncbi:MAG: phenylalanine--tRNA ligase subunit beta [Defluviitaleaceae bacterium]|nr:phenylalanine--tRNA ligase subunit beta [Defluviitaleaceae bacterium]MCL2263766.1 phenylalanine--tRNA ligase subunit beta [Defluviitaleaceae bacterium]